MSTVDALFIAPIVGLAAGVVGSMLGLGGGFIIVPLLNIAGVDMKIAVGTSAAAVFFNAVSATVAYARYGYVLFRVGVLISASAVASAYFGAYLTRYLDVDTLRLAFGSLLLFVALRTATTESGRRTPAATAQLRWGNRALLLLPGGGVLAGLVSGLFGVGGGVVNVPLLTHLGVSMHQAVATSSMTITLTSITSATTHYVLGNVDVPLLAALAPTVLVGAQVGARIARRTSSRTLKRGFSAALVFIALRMVLKSLGFRIP
ncbi:MAG: sulfite exporter TauE/SafE family protein [Sulfolobales archaeon]|nr:sulfite exporter TauE/SafE family protein [Sulfolobales archaeon]